MANVQWTTGDKYTACPLRLNSHGGHVPCVPRGSYASDESSYVNRLTVLTSQISTKWPEIIHIARSRHDHHVRVTSPSQDPTVRPRPKSSVPSLHFVSIFGLRVLLFSSSSLNLSFPVAEPVNLRFLHWIMLTNCYL